MDTNSPSPSPADKVKSLLVIENAPPFGTGKMPVESEKLWAILAHLISIIAWPLKSKDSPVVDVLGKESLNLLINWIPVVVVLSILGMIPILGLIFSLILMVAGLAVFGLVIYNIILSRDSKLLRYPFIIRVLK